MKVVYGLTFPGKYPGPRLVEVLGIIHLSLLSWMDSSFTVYFSSVVSVSSAVVHNPAVRVQVLVVGDARGSSSCSLRWGS